MYVLVTPDAECAKTLSIFGVVDAPVVLGVVEGVVTPKRVVGPAFTFFQGVPDLTGEEVIAETERFRRERMSSLDRDSK